MSVLGHVQKVRFLYKTIMKLHRGLPEELQVLGNGYARDEFKRHKACTPDEAQIFMNEWTDYALNLAKQLSDVKGPGVKGLPSLNESVLDNLRDEQIAQLYELHLAALPENPESGKISASQEDNSRKNI